MIWRLVIRYLKANSENWLGEKSDLFVEMMSIHHVFVNSLEYETQGKTGNAKAGASIQPAPPFRKWLTELFLFWK